jgi:hypothetical protein
MSDDANQPGCVVTLVHGTFARQAAWTQPGSKLRDALTKHLGGKEIVGFERFNWSGDNNHSARLQAGNELRQQLRETVRKHPKAKHFIVAHSHGGNVTLYALRDKQLRTTICGVVCIGTPFITCRERSFTATLHLLSTLITLLAALLPGLLGGGTLAIITTITSHVYVDETGAWFKGILIGVGALMFFGGYSVMIYVSLIKRQLQANVHSRLTTWASRHCAATMQRLHLPQLEQLPVLCVIARRDEAFFGLGSLTILASVPFKVWSLRVYIALWLIGWIISALTLWNSDDALYGRRSFFWQPPQNHPYLQPVDWLVFLFFACSRVVETIAPLLLLHLTALVLVPKVMRAHTLGFGKETVTDNLFARITVSSILLEGWETMRCVPKGTGLRHSRLYEDDSVLSSIGEWIRRHQ